MKCIINLCTNQTKVTEYCSTHRWQLWKYGKTITNGTNKRKPNRYEIEGDITKIYSQNNLGIEKGIFIIDTEDLFKVIPYKWSFNDKYKYVKSNVCPEKRLHRFILNAPKGMEVDHINRDPTDNRKSNLRLVTSSENSLNRAIQSNNKTGYRCISFDKLRKKYVVSIKKDNKIIFNKRFIELSEAIENRDMIFKKIRNGFIYD